MQILEVNCELMKAVILICFTYFADDIQVTNYLNLNLKINKMLYIIM